MDGLDGVRCLAALDTLSPRRQAGRPVVVVAGVGVGICCSGLAGHSHRPPGDAS